MAFSHAERDAGGLVTTTGSALLRRIMIKCPVTGLVTGTGIELSDLRGLVAGPQLLIDCLECGQDHSWHIDDALLD